MDDRDSLNRLVSVSRETYERLKSYQELLLKWQTKINLIGPDTVTDVWQRHFIDSIQLWPLLKNPKAKSVDLGSGAGFPGMVLAILGASDMHLIESDGKKVVFLKEVARLTQTPITIHQNRIEELSIANVETIFSRACSPLSTLFSYAENYVSRETICLFHKGKNCSKELLDSQLEWLFDCSIHPSITESQSGIVEVTNLRKKPKGEMV